ncbi:SurA N-terminal domain-containing protein [Elusimicrobiota bacterium]
MGFLRRYKETFLIITLGTFFLSIFVGVGSFFFIGADTRNLVAKVGKSKLERNTFFVNYNQSLEAMRQQNPEMDITPEMEETIKANILRDMVLRELFVLEAKKLGLGVSPREVSFDIARRPIFQREGRFSPALYYEFVRRNLGILPKDFEAEREKDLLSDKFRRMLFALTVVNPLEVQWIKTFISAENMPEKPEELIAQAQRSKAVDTTNQYLLKLSQKYKVETFLEPAR